MMQRFLSKRMAQGGTSGSAAIEFALIAPVFFMLFFAIFETGLVFFGDLALENGVKESARVLRTGQAQTANMTQAQFRTNLCDQIKFLLSCDTDKLYIDVRAFSNFGSAAYPKALDAKGNLNPALKAYQPGQTSAISGNADIILVRAFYTWQLFTPGFSQYFSNMTGSKRLLAASVAFRTEPY